MVAEDDMSTYPTTQINLKREVPATRIPSGEPVFLPVGTIVRITQSLGGAYTVESYSMGGLFRIAGRDADALGLEVAPEPAAPSAPAEPGADTDENAVWGKLKTVFDPEIPVNVVDLGLVFDMKLSPLPGGGNRVDVKMTLTAPGCGMGASIAGDARMKILEVPGVKEADVELVWEPVWNPSMMTEAAKLTLGLM
jgi:probable FeS assembly SUF system protein SufT